MTLTRGQKVREGEYLKKNLKGRRSEEIIAKKSSRYFRDLGSDCFKFPSF